MAKLEAENLYVSFMDKYDEFRERIGKSREYATLDELLESIKSARFVEEYANDPVFIRELYKLIFEKFVDEKKGEFELAQLWKVFTQLKTNGIEPTSEKNKNLYMEMALRVTAGANESLYDRRTQIHLLDKTKFLLSCLTSFDSSKGLFGALNKAQFNASDFYLYYASFIRRIADVSMHEELTFALLVEQIDQHRALKDGTPDYRSLISNNCDKLVGQLQESNRHRFPENDQLLGKPIEKLIADHPLEVEQKQLDRLPRLIKMPQKTLYVPVGRHPEDVFKSDDGYVD